MSEKYVIGLLLRIAMLRSTCKNTLIKERHDYGDKHAGDDAPTCLGTCYELNRKWVLVSEKNIYNRKRGENENGCCRMCVCVCIFVVLHHPNYAILNPASGYKNFVAWLPTSFAGKIKEKLIDQYDGQIHYEK